MAQNQQKSPQDMFLADLSKTSVYDGWTPDEIRGNVTEVLGSSDQARIGKLWDVIRKLPAYDRMPDQDIEADLRSFWDFNAPATGAVPAPGVMPPAPDVAGMGPSAGPAGPPAGAQVPPMAPSHGRTMPVPAPGSPQVPSMAVSHRRVSPIHNEGPTPYRSPVAREADARRSGATPRFDSMVPSMISAHNPDFDPNAPDPEASLNMNVAVYQDLARERGRISEDPQYNGQVATLAKISTALQSDQRWTALTQAAQQIEQMRPAIDTTNADAVKDFNARVDRFNQMRQGAADLIQMAQEADKIQADQTYQARAMQEDDLNNQMAEAPPDVLDKVEKMARIEGLKNFAYRLMRVLPPESAHDRARAFGSQYATPGMGMHMESYDDRVIREARAMATKIANTDGQEGFAEGVMDNAAQMMPYLGTLLEGINEARLVDISQRREAGTASPSEVALLDATMAWREYEGLVGRSIPYQVGGGMAALVGYMGSFGASQPVAQAVAKGALKLVPKAVIRAGVQGGVAAKIGSKVATKFVPSILGATAQSMTDLPMTFKNFQERQLPDYQIGVSPLGEVIDRKAGRGVQEAWVDLLKAAGTTANEYVTETWGVAADKPLAFLKRMTIGNMVRKNGIRSLDDVAKFMEQRLAVNSGVGEYAEEVFNTAIQTGLIDRASGMKFLDPTSEEGTVTALTVAAPSLFKGALRGTGRVARRYAQMKHQAQVESQGRDQKQNYQALMDAQWNRLRQDVNAAGERIPEGENGYLPDNSPELGQPLDQAQTLPQSQTDAGLTDVPLVGWIDFSTELGQPLDQAQTLPQSQTDAGLTDVPRVAWIDFSTPAAIPHVDGQWQAGERVVTPDGPGTIVAIHRDFVTVDLEDGSAIQIDASELTPEYLMGNDGPLLSPDDEAKLRSFIGTPSIPSNSMGNENADVPGAQTVTATPEGEAKPAATPEQVHKMLQDGYYEAGIAQELGISLVDVRRLKGQYDAGTTAPVRQAGDALSELKAQAAKILVDQRQFDPDDAADYVEHLAVGNSEKNLREFIADNPYAAEGEAGADQAAPVSSQETTETETPAGQLSRFELGRRVSGEIGQSSLSPNMAQIRAAAEKLGVPMNEASRALAAFNDPDGGGATGKEMVTIGKFTKPAASRVDDFIKTYPRIVQRRTREALTSEKKSIAGKFQTRAEYVEKQIGAGAKVETVMVTKAGNKVPERRLVHPDGAFLTEKDLTKTAMDYAAFLTGGGDRNDQAAAKAEAKKQADEQRVRDTETTAKGRDSYSWIVDTFGDGKINPYNSNALSDFLEGKTKKYAGLVGNTWMAGVQKAGALTADGKGVDFAKLKHAYESRTNVPAVKPAAPQKQSWEMTKKEYKDSGNEQSENYHRNGIVIALREGKPVPAHVLAEYPDLQKPARKKFADMRQSEIDQFVADQSRKAAEEAQAIITRNNYAKPYLYYRPGELGAFTDKPDDSWTQAAGETIRGGTTDQIQARVAKMAGGIPFLLDKEAATKEEAVPVVPEKDEAKKPAPAKPGDAMAIFHEAKLAADLSDVSAETKGWHQNFAGYEAVATRMLGMEQGEARTMIQHLDSIMIGMVGHGEPIPPSTLAPAIVKRMLDAVQSSERSGSSSFMKVLKGDYPARSIIGHKQSAEKMETYLPDVKRTAKEAGEAVKFYQDALNFAEALVPGSTESDEAVTLQARLDVLDKKAKEYVGGYQLKIADIKSGENDAIEQENALREKTRTFVQASPIPTKAADRNAAIAQFITAELPEDHSLRTQLETERALMRAKGKPGEPKLLLDVEMVPGGAMQFKPIEVGRVKVVEQKLEAVLKTVGQFVSDDELRESMMAVEMNAEKGTLVATDGHTLFVEPSKLVKETRLIYPSGLPLMVTETKKVDGVDQTVQREAITQISGDVKNKDFDTQYPNWPAVVPEDTERLGTLTVEAARALVETTENANKLFTYTGMEPFYVALRSGDRVQWIHPGKLALVLKAMQALGAKRLEVHVRSGQRMGTGALMIKDADNTDRFALVMPVRVIEEDKHGVVYLIDQKGNGEPSKPTPPPAPKPKGEGPKPLKIEKKVRPPAGPKAEVAPGKPSWEGKQPWEITSQEWTDMPVGYGTGPAWTAFHRAIMSKGTFAEAQNAARAAAKEGREIQDFGEKIGGARKDVWKRRGLIDTDLDHMTDIEQHEHVTKDNVWKKIDYPAVIASGVSRETAYVMKMIRDAIPAKPSLTRDYDQNKQRYRDYVEMVGRIRDAVGAAKSLPDLMNLYKKVFRAEEMVIQNQGYSNSVGFTDEGKRLARQLGRHSWGPMSLTPEGYALRQGLRTMESAGWMLNEEPWKQAARKHSFEIRRMNPDVTDVQEWVVTRYTHQVVWSGKSEEEATAWLKNKMETDYQEKGSTSKKPKFKDPVRPMLEGVKRKGMLDYREGKDVTEKKFQDTFGFRAGEFGNWLTNADRQQSLNHAYDALRDFARILHIPPKAISLNGELAFAFGARGHGRAMAHYEPGRVVINLTKMNGAGTAAHEWFHALDHYLFRLTGEKRPMKPYVTEGVPREAVLRQEIRDALEAIGVAIKERVLTQQESVEQQKKYIDESVDRLNGWLKATKRNYEMGHTTYLRRGKGTETKKPTAANVEEFDVLAERARSAADPRPFVNEINEHVKSTIGVYPDNNHKDGMKWAADRVSGANKGMQKILAGEQLNTVTTDFLNSAKRLDSTRTNPYWATPVELFARAGEAWAQNEMEKNDMQSQYLVSGTEHKYYEAEKSLGMISGNPYPGGEELDQIGRAYRNLFNILQTEETPQGTVRMFSLGEPARTREVVAGELYGTEHTLTHLTRSAMDLALSERLTRERAALVKELAEIAEQERNVSPQQDLFTKRGMDVADVQRAVGAVVRRMPGLPTNMVQVVNTRDQLPKDAQGSRLQRVKGVYWTITSGAQAGNVRIYMVASEINSQAEAVETFLHEAVGHYGVRQVLGENMNPILDDIWKQYEQAIRRSSWFPRYLENNVGTVAGQRRLAEEYLAHMAEEADPYENRTLWQRILDAIRRWASSIHPAFGRALNIDMARSIVADAYRYTRDGGPAIRTQAAAPMSRRDTSSFDAWFGDSKVRNADGSPMVVYHGTSAPDFSRFKRKTTDIGMHFGSAGQANDRIWYLSRNKGVAADGTRLYPVYLRINNPLRLSDIGAWNNDNMVSELTRVLGDKVVRAAGIYADSSLSEIRKFIEDQGYDGIIYRNTGEVEGGEPYARTLDEASIAAIAAQRRRGKPVNVYDKEDQQTPEYKARRKAFTEYEQFRKKNAKDSYIVFRPEQIKSATGNRGTFDIEDPNILNARGESNFDRWFQGSRVVNADGTPRRVYRGEHGARSDRQFDTLLPSLTFSSDPEVASIYAETPNQTGPTADASRVTPVYLSIRNPIIESTDDPFIEMSDIAKKFGMEEARRLATVHSDEIEGLDYWDENYAAEYKSVEDFLQRNPGKVPDGSIPVWKALDDPQFVELAKAKGYDGAIHEGTGEGASSLEFRVFSANQVKSATGNSGEFSPTNPDIRYATARQQQAINWYYSQMEKALGTLLPGRSRGVDLAEMMNKWIAAGKFKADEYYWSGLESWIRSNDRVLTSADVRAYVREANVQMEELVLSDAQREDVGELFDQREAIESEFRNFYEGIGAQSAPFVAGVPLAWYMRNEAGENVLVPEKHIADLEAFQERINDLDGRMEALHDDAFGTTVEGTTETRFSWLTLPGAEPTSYREFIIKLVRPDIEFYGPDAHWGDVKSPVLHVRMAIHTDSSGRRIAVIEELQSDWAEKGREQGFKTTTASMPRRPADQTVLPPDTEMYSWVNIYDGKKRYQAVYIKNNDSKREAGAGEPAETEQQAIDNGWDRVREDAIYQERRSDQPAAAPFVEKTTQWAGLGIKRIIRWAAENGIDRVGWTPGMAQARRYAKAMDVKSITWGPKGEMEPDGYRGADYNPEDKTLYIRMRRSDQSTLVLMLDTDNKVKGPVYDSFSGKHLGEIIGKEMAAKIIAADRGKLSGSGITVGSKGMEGFYDKIMVNTANDIIKKYGASVGETSLPLPSSGVRNKEGGLTTQDKRALRDLFRRSIDLTYEEFNDEFQVITALNMPVNEFDMLVDKMGDPYINDRVRFISDSVERTSNRVKDTPTGDLKLHSFDITDSLREVALTEGFPMYLYGGQTAETFPQHIQDVFDGKYDGKVRFEINDREARLYPEFMYPTGISDFEEDHGYWPNLGEVLDHPELYAAYPTMRDVQVVVDYKLGSNAAANPEEALIALGSEVTDPRRSLLHEVQHMIQMIEGFARGGSTKAPLVVSMAKEEAGFLSPTGGVGLAEQHARYKYYRRLAGEIEARDVQHRMNLTDTGRRRIKPYSHENIDPANAIVTFDPSPRVFDVDEETGQGMFQYAAPAQATPAPAQIGGYYGNIPMRSTIFNSPLERRESWLTFVREVQNYMIDVKNLQEGKFIGRGGVPDSQNVSRKETLMYGKVEERIREYRNKYAQPLIENLARIRVTKGITLDDVRKYLYAKHAPERNQFIRFQSAAYIASLGQALARTKDPVKAAEIRHRMDILNSGSRMTDGEARRIIDDFNRRGLTQDLQDIGDRVRAIVQFDLKNRLNDGLITQEYYDELIQRYRFYVPLRGFETDLEDGDIPRTGRGFDIRGPEWMSAHGRGSYAGPVLEYALAQAEEGIVRGEKNKVQRAFYDFVKANPDKENYRIMRVWFVRQVDATSKMPVIDENGLYVYHMTFTRPSPADLSLGHVKMHLDPSTDMVEQGVDVTALMRTDNVVALKIDGKPVYIDVVDPNIGRAMKKLNMVQQGAMLRGLHRFMAWQRMTITQYNPEFTVSNFFRDLNTAVFHLGAEFGIKDTAAIVSGIPSAMAGMHRALRGDYSTPAAQHARDYMANGGQTGWWDTKTMEQRVREMIKDVDRTANSRTPWRMTMKTLHTILEMVDHINRVVENGVRFSSYQHMRDTHNWVPERAAEFAKDLTVNFNRKGQKTSLLNTLYLFFNANVQGTARMAQGFFSRDKRLRSRSWALAATIMAGGFIMQTLVRLWMGKGPDDEYYYDKINEWTRKHNLIIPNFLSDNPEDYFRIPLPYGYNIFWAISDDALSIAKGDNVVSSLVGTLATGMDAFSPLGAAESKTYAGRALKLILPTFADPIAELALNEDFAGRNIFPGGNPFDRTPPPPSEMYFDGVNEIIKEGTDALNSGTGGDDVTAGAISWSPEVVEYLLGYLYGGVGRFGLGLTQTIMQAAGEGKEIEAFNVPFVRGLTGKVSPAWDRQRFRDNVRRMYEILEQIKKYNDAKDFDMVKKIKAEYPVIQQMATGKTSQLKVAEKHLRQLKAQERKETDPKELKLLREAERKLQQKFNKSVKGKL